MTRQDTKRGVRSLILSYHWPHTLERLCRSKHLDYHPTRQILNRNNLTEMLLHNKSVVICIQLILYKSREIDTKKLSKQAKSQPHNQVLVRIQNYKSCEKAEPGKSIKGLVRTILQHIAYSKTNKLSKIVLYSIWLMINTRGSSSNSDTDPVIN